MHAFRIPCRPSASRSRSRAANAPAHRCPRRWPRPRLATPRTAPPPPATASPCARTWWRRRICRNRWSRLRHRARTNQALLQLTVRDANGDNATPVALQATVSDLRAANVRCSPAIRAVRIRRPHRAGADRGAGHADLRRARATRAGFDLDRALQPRFPIRVECFCGSGFSRDKLSQIRSRLKPLLQDVSSTNRERSLADLAHAVGQRRRPGCRMIGDLTSMQFAVARRNRPSPAAGESRAEFLPHHEPRMMSGVAGSLRCRVFEDARLPVVRPRVPGTRRRRRRCGPVPTQRMPVIGGSSHSSK